MSIAVDNRQQQQFGAGAFAPADHPQMRFYSTTPQFTNPWQQPSQQQQPASYGAPSTDDAAAARSTQGHARSHSQHAAPNVSMGYQQQAPALSMPSGTYSHAGSFSHHLPQVDSPLQGFMSNPAGSMARYSTDLGNTMFGQLPMKPQDEGMYAGQPQIRSNSYASLANRKASHPSVPAVTMASPASTVSSDNSLMNFGTAPAMPSHQNSSSLDFLCSLHNASEAERSSFSDALDASRGMVAMSQDITPRNIYDVHRASRASIDSYGFPPTHSHSSSFSSSSGYPMYYGSSVSEASYGDYSSANESVSGRSSYSGSYMGGSLPAGPATMMGHFSSKVNSSSQKKHKCKICDKRFTRPSSLQTHMYSHTGEKPFACDVEGCGRQFSVVSNLRRHRKVHRGEHEGESGNYSDADD